MKLLTKNTDYAVRSLRFLAKNQGKFSSTAEIAKGEHIPLPFLRRVIQELVSSGYVRSKEGTGGGYELVRDPGKIYLVKLIQQFQGNVDLSNCICQKTLCENNKDCVLRKKIMNLQAAVTRELETIRISDLLK